MTILTLVISWFFGILFGLLMLSMFLTGSYLQAIILMLLVLVLLPPTRYLLNNLSGQRIPAWGHILLMILLLTGFILLSRANLILLTPINGPVIVGYKHTITSDTKRSYSNRVVNATYLAAI